MMVNDKEIHALLQLVDDPDTEVFDTVAAKLMHYGKAIIPKLESVWGATADEYLQERIEQLIHRVHFNDLQNDFMEWSQAEHPSLLRGAILIAKYRYPELDEHSIHKQFEHIRRNVWLELNNYLSPLERVNVINSIFYSYYKLEGHELTDREAKYFFINQTMETKQGNAYTIGILYLAICEVLDVPIFAVDIPRQFIFAYLDTLYSFLKGNKEGVQHIEFFIDPISGMAYTHSDIETYLDKINAPDRAKYFKPLSTKRIICKMLEELSLCYHYNHEEQSAEEMLQIIRMIENNTK